MSEEVEGVPAENLWNYDETNLSDDPGNKRVLTKRGVKYPERIQDSTKSSISLMFCGNAVGELLPPYTVYKSAHLWSTWTEGGPPMARYNRSLSGWFDTTCFYDWFMTIVVPRLKKQKGRKILIGDNLSSHINEKVLSVCRELNIKFIALPPNSTHLTQPLDVAFFRPMKGAWRTILDDCKMKCKRASATLQKQEFPRLLSDLMEALTTRGADNLMSGFRKTGIYPLQQDEVLKRLPDAQDQAYASISESFLAFLKNERMSCKETKKTIKKRKLDIIPGKSIGGSSDTSHQAESQHPPLPPPPPFAVPISSATSSNKPSSSLLPPIASLVCKPTETL